MQAVLGEVPYKHWQVLTLELRTQAGTSELRLYIQLMPLGMDDRLVLE